MRVTLPPAERFWPKVAKGEPDECWLWTAYLEPAWGYGIFRMYPGQQMWKAHRAAWVLERGPIPDGLIVCHHCDNPPCVNPAHLFVGTWQDNVDDRVAKNRSGRTGPGRGEAAPNVTLTEVQVREIRRRYAAGGVSQSALGAEYGVGQTQVGRIVRGTRWAHVA